MSKIIIVGHPDSGHTQVEKLLFRCGMRPANPSRRDGLTAPEVVRSICKAMRVPMIDEITNPDDYRQINPGAVWNGLVLDLMLGNLEHDLWGWADSQALLLLEYFEGLDPQMTFVLVYNDPRSVLLEPLHTLDQNTSEQISKDRLDRWTAYNSAMLHFFLRNHSRCILVHAKGVRIAAEQYLSMLQARLAAPLQVPEEVDAVESKTTVIESLPSHGSREVIVAPDTLKSALSRVGGLSHLNADDFFGRAAESFLIDQILLKHNASRQLFEELQASSNLPIAPEVMASASAESAWKAFLKQRWFASQLVARIHADSQLREAEKLRHAQERARLEGEKASIMEGKSRVQEKVRLHQEALAAQKLEIQRHIKEQKKLIEKHEQALKKVEALSLENSQLKKKTAKPAAPSGAAARVKAQLSYRLGIIMTQQSKSFTGLLGLPFALVREKRKFDRERAKTQGEKHPPLHEYADARHAEQLKKQLSYRLGNALVRNSTSFSGWIRMPFSIIHQIRQFRKDRAANKK